MKLSKIVLGALLFAAAAITFAAPPPKQSSEATVEFVGLGVTTARDFTFSVENNINSGSISGGGGVGKAKFSEFAFSKVPDELSTILYSDLLDGRHYDEVVITSGNVQITLSFVFVSKITLDKQDCLPKEGPSCAPRVENVSLVFGQAFYEVL